MGSTGNPADRRGEEGQRKDRYQKDRSLSDEQLREEMMEGDQKRM